jgi:uncharacterized protein (TIGR03437 family)
VILASGTIQTVAGNGVAGFAGDGGPALKSEMNSLRQVAVGTFGDIYIADSLNNAIRKLTASSTTVGHVTNAFGDVPQVAQNTWIAVKGTDLARPGDSRIWLGSDFVNGQMPTALDGVSVTLTGPNGYQASAYVYYISPTQINILAPPNLQPGVVQFQVNNNGAQSAPASVAVQSLSPSLFVYNGGPYVIAAHAIGGGIVGPTTLFPGSSTPAVPGETIVLVGNGFGPTSVPVTPGSSVQSGTLSSLPVITIGGIQAEVQFAGLISPGLYQFNVVVPKSAPSGDNSITATYGGSTTQSGTLLTVEP